nr:hepatocyte growth factor activator isoform X2 [Paramormyrops kingsleyae]
MWFLGPIHFFSTLGRNLLKKVSLETTNSHLSHILLGLISLQVNRAQMNRLARAMFALVLLRYVFSASTTRGVLTGSEVINTRTIVKRSLGKVFTVDGQECKFPFRYAGMVHHQCLPTHSSRFWCSTTSNFDRDRKWAFCVSEELGTSAADPCQDHPCANGGLCTSDPRRGAFVCHCPEPFTGNLCSQEKCYEESHRKHYDLGESWGRIHMRGVEQCTCEGGQAVCERARYTACDRNPCQNEGTCRSLTSTGEVVCACRAGLGGGHCSINLEERCYEGNGVDYRGTARTTLSGAHCLPWSSELLHTELSLTNAETAALLANVESTMELGLGDHAFCRNPDGDTMPWCYTLKNTAISWEYCDIPSCRLPGNTRLVMPTVQPTTTTQTQPSRPPTCGTRHMKRSARPRILGGHAALPGAHPWMAAIFIGESFCAGTLIASCWVLSAAHCFSGNPLASQVRVILGQHRFNDTGPNTKSHRIEKYIFYDKYSVYNPTVHDIVLVKLKKEKGKCAKMTQFVRPICLPGEDMSFPDYHCCDITGWGHMYEKANAYADQLMEGVVYIVPFEQCSRPNMYGTEVTPTMLCAGHWCVDACQGDSGGPLACSRNGVYFLYGIVSWGDGCGRSRKPGVYTRVTKYVNWIQKVTKSKP